MWIVCLLCFAVFLKLEDLERLEKSGIIKNITYFIFICQEQNLNEMYIKNEDWNFKVHLLG